MSRHSAWGMTGGLQVGVACLSAKTSSEIAFYLLAEPRGERRQCSSALPWARV